MPDTPSDHMKTYTENEAWHLAAKEVAKQRKGDLERMIAFEKRLGNVEKRIDENTSLTLQLNSSIQQILDIMDAGKGGLRVLGWMGAGLKVLAGTVAAIITLWAAYNGKLPGQ